MAYTYDCKTEGELHTSVGYDSNVDFEVDHDRMAHRARGRERTCVAIDLLDTQGWELFQVGNGVYWFRKAR